MASMLKLDNFEYDLNALFSFQHNYDMLKKLIEALAKMQKSTQQKMSDLEGELAGKNKQIDNLERHISNLTNNTERRLKNIESGLGISVSDSRNGGSINNNNSLNANFNTNSNLSNVSSGNLNQNTQNTMNNMNNINNNTPIQPDTNNRSNVNDNNNLNTTVDKTTNQNQTSVFLNNTNDQNGNAEQNVTDKNPHNLIINNNSNLNVNNIGLKANIVEGGENLQESNQNNLNNNPNISNMDNISNNNPVKNQNQNQRNTINYTNITNTRDVIHERVIIRDESGMNNNNVNLDNLNNVNLNNENINERMNTDESKFSKKMSFNLSGELETQEIINKLLKRIMKLEKEMQECNKVNAEFLQAKGKIADNGEFVAEHGNAIKTIREDLDNLIKKTEPWEENLEKLNVKVMDFNIYDLFKGAGEGGSADAAVLLVQNLDNKITQKISFVDRRIKILEEDLFKTKGEVTNLKSVSDGHGRTLSNVKEDIEKLFNSNTQMSEELKNSSNNLELMINENQAKSMKSLEENVQDLRNLINQKDELLKLTEENFNNELNKTKSNNTGGFSEQDAKVVKDVGRKVMEVEKTLRLFIQNVNIDFIKSELTRLSEGLNSKVSITDFAELKEATNQLTYQINFIKDTLSQVVEDRKILADVSWLRKKVEQVASSLLTMKSEQADGSNSMQMKGMPIDTSKFLELSIFTEFQKGYNRELDGIRRDTDEMKRFLDDIIVALKTKSSDKDLKNLEEYLITKLEELRLNSNKKFADKSDTQKNIKYLDAQVKHIIDVYIKKMEKGDNWLLAKKPVNGYNCASCEAYIGDLHDKTNDYVPWNKYPIRDPNDKAYRVNIIFNT